MTDYWTLTGPTLVCLLQAGHWLRTLAIENSSMCGSGWSHDLLRAHVNFSLRINTWGEYWQNASAKNYLKRLTHRFECSDFASHLLHHSVILLLQHLMCFHGTHAVTVIAYWGICIHVGEMCFHACHESECVCTELRPSWIFNDPEALDVSWFWPPKQLTRLPRLSKPRKSLYSVSNQYMNLGQEPCCSS